MIFRHSVAVFLLIFIISVSSRSITAQDQRWNECNQKIVMLYKEGKVTGAITVAREALALAEKTFGAEHVNTATSLGWLAFLLDMAHQYEEAEPYYRKTLALREKLLGTEDPATIITMNGLALMYRKMRRHAQAEPLLKKVLTTREKLLGTGHPDTTISMDNLALCYDEMRRYGEAEALYRKVVALKEKALGADNPETALSLNNLAAFYEQAGRYAEAEPLYTRALTITEKSMGPGHAATVASLNNLAFLYKKTGRFKEAEPLYRRALAACEQALGPENPSTASYLNNLASLLQELGRNNDAEPLYRRALAIQEKALGPDHPSTALTCNNLASLYEDLGRYGAAEDLYNRALAAGKKTLGPAHHHTLSFLNNLASLYQKTGRYGKAEPLCILFLAEKEKAVGPDHPETATGRDNLAALYAVMGRYSEAEPLYKAALEAREKVLGPGHPAVAASLDNLASLYLELGRFNDAEPLYTRALAIREKLLGPEHPTTAVSLNNMAKLYYELGFYAKAEPLYQRALAIQEKTLGPGHSSTAALLNNLAQLYYPDNPPDGRAEPLQKRALAIREKTLGPGHPATATCLDNLSAIYSAQGRFREAGPLCTRALAIREKALGPMHPYTARTLINLATLREMQNHPAEALALMKRVLAIQDRAIEKAFSISSENEKFGFLFFYDISDSYSSFLNLVTQTMKKDPEARRAGLDAVLRRKGLVVDALSRERDSLARSERSPIKSKLQELERVTSLITSLTLAGRGSSTPEGYMKELGELEAAREKLDRELANQSSEYAAGRSARCADTGSVAQKLPSGSALVEYISIPFLAPSMQGAPRERGEKRYYAFVLHSSRDKDSRAVPELVELGSAEVIDRAVKEFHLQVREAQGMWESQVLDEASMEKQLNEKGRALYHLVVAPLKKALGERTTLFVAPDGDLNLVPFGALQDDENHYMLEDYEINYLSCGRDLLRSGAGQASGAPTVIFANPDFTMTLSGKSPREPEREMRGLADLGSFIWSPLPGTGKEAENITKILANEPVILFSGTKALKSEMTHLSAPRRLHIATHGFFLKRTEDPQDPPAGKGKAVMAGDLKLAPPLQFDNLLLRSGLVFAGAHSPGPEKFSQGIMTALEVSTLNLRGTDLVVLSACETGSGTSLPGEGVFGLRRSFQLAGARTVVMSLWSVPDEETQQLMTLFYRNLKGGEGKSAALRNAALAMIKERREKHGAAHPFFWASFIAVGE